MHRANGSLPFFTFMCLRLLNSSDSLTLGWFGGLTSPCRVFWLDPFCWGIGLFPLVPTPIRSASVSEGFLAPSLLFVFGALCTLKIAWDILAC